MSDKDFFNDFETRIDFTIVTAIQQVFLEARIIAAIQQILCNFNFQSAFMSSANTVAVFTFIVSFFVQNQSEFKQALSNLDFQLQQQNVISAAELFKLTDIEFFDSE